MRRASTGGSRHHARRDLPLRVALPVAAAGLPARRGVLLPVGVPGRHHRRPGHRRADRQRRPERAVRHPAVAVGDEPAGGLRHDGVRGQPRASRPGDRHARALLHDADPQARLPRRPLRRSARRRPRRLRAGAARRAAREPDAVARSGSRRTLPARSLPAGAAGLRRPERVVHGEPPVRPGHAHAEPGGDLRQCGRHVRRLRHRRQPAGRHRERDSGRVARSVRRRGVRNGNALLDRRRAQHDAGARRRRSARQPADRAGHCRPGVRRRLRPFLVHRRRATRSPTGGGGAPGGLRGPASRVGTRPRRRPERPFRSCPEFPGG